MGIEASYVGQTKRQLHTRISEHKNHIRRNATSRSVLTDYRINFDHDFNWEEVEILDDEPHLHKRLISEVLHIKRQKRSLNLQTDMEFLPEVYLTVLDKLPKI